MHTHPPNPPAHRETHTQECEREYANACVRACVCACGRERLRLCDLAAPASSLRGEKLGAQLCGEDIPLLFAPSSYCVTVDRHTDIEKGETDIEKGMHAHTWRMHREERVSERERKGGRKAGRQKDVGIHAQAVCAMVTRLTSTCVSCPCASA
jgi:hypothetical protein